MKVGFLSFLGLIAICLLALGITKMIINFIKLKSYFKRSDLEVTGRDITRSQLDKQALSEISIAVWGVGIFAKYSVLKKRITMSPRVSDGKSLASIAVATRAVATASLYNDNKRLYKNQFWAELLNCVLGFVFSISLITGVIMILINKYVVPAVIINIIVLALFMLSFVLMLTKFNTNKKINDKAMQMLNEMGVFNQEDLKELNKLFKSENILVAINLALNAVIILQLVFQFFALLCKKK